MKKILNEYDDTKRLLNIIRGLSLNEQIEDKNDVVDYNKEEMSSDEYSTEKTDSNVDNINDVDVNLVSSDKVDLSLTSQQRQVIANLIDSFREQVSQTANLEPGFTFVTGQVRLDGVIQENDLKFVFIAGNEAGLYINSQMLKVDDQVLPLIEKLYKFQEQFNDAIDTMIRERQNN